MPTPRPVSPRSAPRAARPTLAALLLLAAPLAGCPAPGPVNPSPPAADGAAAEDDTPQGPEPAPDSSPPPADATPDPGEDPLAANDPAAAAFQRLCAALAAGSARDVRALVPPDASLLTRRHVCRKPVYGVGTCRDDRVEAERRRVTDELLAPWQEAVAAAAARRSADGAGEPPVECAPAEGPRVRCVQPLVIGHDACRGDWVVRIEALLQPAGDEWILLELGYDEEILVCE